MNKLQFRVLYREFLFRMVDLELLSAHAQGDTMRLLGQFAALLVFTSLVMTGEALAYGSREMQPAVALIVGWNSEHNMIATTMLVVGLFAVLSWDSTFPDKRDVMVLAPLPVRARTMFLAKVAALATALTLTVAFLHVLCGMAWPFAIVRQSVPLTVPALGFDPAVPSVDATQIEAVLGRDLDDARQRALMAGVEDHPPGWGVSIGVSKQGVRRVFSYGTARPDSLFEIGSLTKTFTTLALARMAVDGKVFLDKPVREPDPRATPVRSPWQPITFLDLATDRSSLPPWPDNLPPINPSDHRTDYGVEDLHHFAFRRGTIKPPEVHFIDSNVGSALLGQLLAERAGIAYPQLVQDEITGPLGMRDTVVELPPELADRLIVGHQGTVRPTLAWGFSAFAPAAGIHSTAGDMLTYLESYLHPENLPAPFGKALVSCQQRQAVIAPGVGIGLGWKTRIGEGIWYREGATNGYSSYALFKPAEDYAVVVLMNNGQNVGSSAERLAEHIRQRLTGEPVLPLANAMIPARRGIGGVIRALLAYWITMFAAGAFIYGSVLTLQGLAAQFPRRYFLRLSSLLQLASFCLFLCVYFLQPPLGDPFSSQWDAPLLNWLPSFWFLGLFHWLNGSLHPALSPLAHRALAGSALAIAGTGVAFLASYYRTLRKIVEEPDILPATRGWNWLPRFGNSLETAIVQFSIRTLLRSRLHRVILAFYLGIGFALTIVLVRSAMADPRLAQLSDTSIWRQVNVPMLAADVLMLGFWIAGARVVFAMPLDLRGNWVFRVTPVRGGRACLAARRRSFWALAALPAWAGSAVLVLWLWPWRPALQHLAILGLLAVILVELSLRGVQKIPFACSYLPAKTNFHPFWIFIPVLVVVVVRVAMFEQYAIENRMVFLELVLSMALAALIAWWRVTPEKWEQVPVEFEEVPVDHILVLGLPKDGGRSLAHEGTNRALIE
ncbi:MAG TPA: serine hydrolase domain-containing protein [Bryobacteraceae bacterium]|nr:serine hydrolase domain-containing protein [Bryobacteraceae bacterium]